MDGDLTCAGSTLKTETEGAERYLEGVNGLLVPGGFGNRGVDGKIWQFNMPAIARYRFGCLGMQCSVIEWARHLAGLEDANSAEFAPMANIQ